MALLAIDVSRLIHHHLLKEGYHNTANSFVDECPHLHGLPKPVTKPYKLPRLIGPTLLDLLEAYFEAKDHIIEELEALESANFREQDSLQTLIKTLVESVKLGASSSLPTRATVTSDAASNTEIVPLKRTVDTAVNTDTVSSYSVDASVNTESPKSPVNVEEVSPSSADDDECVISLSQVYDRLLEDTELHEKIAENINKKVLSPLKESFNAGAESTLTQDLNQVIKAIVAETQKDPVFEHILQDCIGAEDSSDATSTGTAEAPLSQRDDGNLEHPESLQDIVETPAGLQQPPNSCVQTAGPLALPAPTMPLNTLSSFAIVAAPNGQLTLIPSMLPTLTSAQPTDVPAVKKNKKRQKAPPVPKAPHPKRSTQVAILPKPVFTITIPPPEVVEECAIAPFNPAHQEVSAAVANAVSEAVSGFSPSKSIEPAEEQRPEEVPVMPDKPKPLLKIKRALTFRNRPRKNPHHRLGPAPRKIVGDPPPGPSTTHLADLLKIAQEQCKVIEPEVEEPPVVNPPTPDPITIVTTPTSTRRRSHVRQLNFGESPSDESASPTCRPKVDRKNTTAPKSDIPWDSFLRTVALPSSSVEPAAEERPVFATPKGKAKRARKKSSPSGQSRSSDSDGKTTAMPVTSADSVEGPSDQEIVVITVEEQSPDSRNPNPVGPVLAEEARPVDGGGTSSASISNGGGGEVAQPLPPPVLPHFGSSSVGTGIGEIVFQQPSSLPVLATPRKEEECVGGGLGHAASATCDGHSSNSFGTWLGEVPRTPQIRMDTTGSISPFLVSLTKGFGFLPAADSPSLAIPSTPSIGGIYSNASGSIETPYTGFYQFPASLNTPRVDALRQERMESPGKGLSTTMISPTQVVLGRSAPYFVPSGERAQGPIINQNATPEHVSEPDKPDRRRRSSTEMDPLQLEEESNDASDEGAALMRQAAASATAALQQQQQQEPTPSKKDQDLSLESALISECRRLEKPASAERRRLQKERFRELFGEDSQSQSMSAFQQHVALVTEGNHVSEGAVSSRTRKSSKEKKDTDTCARFQDYGNYREQNPRRTPSSVASHSDNSQHSATGSEKAGTDKSESVIQEILALNSKAKKSSSSAEVSKKSKSRKRRSHPTTDTDCSEDQAGAKSVKRSSKTSKSASASKSSPREEIDVIGIFEVQSNPASENLTEETTAVEIDQSSVPLAKDSDADVPPPIAASHDKSGHSVRGSPTDSTASTAEVNVQQKSPCDDGSAGNGSAEERPSVTTRLDVSPVVVESASSNPELTPPVYALAQDSTLSGKPQEESEVANKADESCIVSDAGVSLTSEKEETVSASPKDVENDPKPSRGRATRKQPAREADKSSADPATSAMSSPTKRSPAKAVKRGLPPRGRKAVSFRQSICHKLSPKKCAEAAGAESAQQQMKETIVEAPPPSHPEKLTASTEIVENVCSTDPSSSASLPQTIEADAPVLDQPTTTKEAASEQDPPTTAEVVPVNLPEATVLELVPNAELPETVGASNDTPAVDTVTSDSGIENAPTEKASTSSSAEMTKPGSSVDVIPSSETVTDERRTSPKNPSPATTSSGSCGMQLSQSELHDYIRLLPTLGTRVEVSPPSSAQQTGPFVKPTSAPVDNRRSGRQQKRRSQDIQELHKNLVHQIQKKLRMSKEVCAFSQ